MRVSVLIPTRNRAAFLTACLESLCQQTLDPRDYEICVVNNGSTDATPQVVAACAEKYPQHSVFMVNEPRIGLSHARNRGMQLTTAPFIAYGDDDATMPPDWLERYLDRFATLPEDTAKVGGGVIPVWQTPRPAWISEVMLGPLTASAAWISRTATFISGTLLECNCMCRRQAIEQAGGYPPQLGRQGNTLLSGEGAVDHVIRHQGGRLFFDPAITIHHTIHADRLNPAWFRKRYFWQGVSTWAAHLFLMHHKIPTLSTVSATLPLDLSDWAFVNERADDPPAPNFEGQLARLQTLGFVLAKTGLVPVGSLDM